MADGILRYPGPKEVPDVPEISFAEYVLSEATQYGSAVAFIDSQTKEETTFLDVVDKARRLAAGLQREVNLSKNDYVAIALSSCVEHTISILAVTLCGAVASFVNPIYKPRELDHVIGIIQPALWICGPEFVPRLQSWKSNNNKDDSRIIVVGTAEGCPSWNDTVSRGDWNEFRAPDIDAREDVATMPFSSGTTGFPKGVMLTHHNLVNTLILIKTLEMVTPGTRILAFLPFFHQYGCVLSCASLIAGSLSVVMRKFNFVNMLQALQDFKVTYLPLVPPVAVQLCKNPVVDGYRLSLEYILSNAASLSPDMMERLEEKFNCSVEQAYGMTEMSSISHYTPRDECRQRHGSVGLTVPYWQVKVCDPATGRTLGPKEPGEICAKGPMLMKGYRGNPGSTAAMIDEQGWLHSGDIGFYDELGWFYVTDRMKELIKYKGFQVSPNELEHLLLSHPSVADAAVIGIPDPDAGELPRAFVVTRPGAGITEEHLDAFVAEHAAPYKKLRGGIVFVDSIPKSPSGKILRRELQNL